MLYERLATIINLAVEHSVAGTAKWVTYPASGLRGPGGVNDFVLLFQKSALNVYQQQGVINVAVLNKAGDVIASVAEDEIPEEDGRQLAALYRYARMSALNAEETLSEMEQELLRGKVIGRTPPDGETPPDDDIPFY